MKSEVWGLKAEGVAFIILRKSFSVYSVCSVDFFLVAYGKKSLEEIFD